jgi:hypothetical protein
LRITPEESKKTRQTEAEITEEVFVERRRAEPETRKEWPSKIKRTGPQTK